MALLAALLSLVLACANYLLHRDPMYPAFLQASLWFGALSLFSVFQGMFVPVPDSVFGLLVAGVFFTLKATTDWFAPKAFAGGLLTLIVVAFFEAFQARRGRIAEVILDADRAASERAKEQT